MDNFKVDKPGAIVFQIVDHILAGAVAMNGNHCRLGTIPTLDLVGRAHQFH